MCSSEQHRSNWQQFLANQEELKAIKKEMAEEEEHMVPLEVPAEESTSGGSWKPVEWQAVDIDQEREDNAEFMEHEHVSFSMV
jgi:hypothetical protein